MKNRVIAFILTIALCFGLLSVTAFGSAKTASEGGTIVVEEGIVKDTEKVYHVYLNGEPYNDNLTVAYYDGEDLQYDEAYGSGVRIENGCFASPGDYTNMLTSYKNLLNEIKTTAEGKENSDGFAKYAPIHLYQTSTKVVFQEACTHVYKDEKGYDVTGHYDRQCELCGKGENPEPHVMNLKDNGDGTHTGTCNCGYSVEKEPHNFGTRGVCACGLPEEGKATVTFNANGGNLGEVPEKVQVNFGDPVAKPDAKPTHPDGSEFLYWSESVKGAEYDFSTPVYKDSNRTLFAQWKTKDPVNPGKDTDTKNEGGSEVKPGGDLTTDETNTIGNSTVTITGDADKKVADDLVKKVANNEKLVAEARTKLGATDTDEIVFVAKPVLRITPASYSKGEKPVLVMDITGEIQVYASIKGGDGKEVPIGDAEKINNPVEIVVELPELFHNKKEVFVGHKVNEKYRYQYRATPENNSDKRYKFTNPHGFSEFRLGLDDEAVASNNAHTDFDYLDFETAASEANKGETLTIKKDCSEDLKLKDGVKVTLADNVKFTGKINGESVELSSDSVYTVGGSTTDKTGGSGGGSSKPSIKPGTTTTPTDPITNPEDQTGTVAGFSDVAASAWYADAVKYVVDRGLFGGVGNGRFAPDANMTRAMMWTVLARYKGVDTSTGSNWYEAARTWAMQQNISDGTMADGNVTREQFVTMLWRLSGEPAANNSASFTDNGRVSAYAKTAVDWAVAQGIVNGYNDGSFRPQGSATRAEVAKMLMVFCVTSEG